MLYTYVHVHTISVLQLEGDTLFLTCMLAAVCQAEPACPPASTPTAGSVICMHASQHACIHDKFMCAQRDKLFFERVRVTGIHTRTFFFSWIYVFLCHDAYCICVCTYVCFEVCVYVCVYAHVYTDTMCMYVSTYVYVYCIYVSDSLYTPP
jgi:hypothetical protein